MSFSRSLLFISIALIPLQVYAVPVRSTLLDISVIFFILCYFTSSIRSIKVFAFLFIGFIAYSLLVSGIWSIGVPLARIVSSSFFYSFLFSVYIRGSDLPFVDIKLVSTAIECATILSFISLLMFWIGFNPFDKTGFLFSERSFANLFYCASFSFYLSKFFQLSLKLSSLRDYYVLFSLLICLFGILSFPAVHPLSLLVALAIVFIPLIHKSFIQFFSILRINKYFVLLLILFIPVVIVSTSLLLNSEHINHRIASIFGQSGKINLSSLVYLSGLYQLTNSLSLCPLTGCGPGSPGYLGLNLASHLSRLTPNMYLVDLASSINIYDLYSLFNRAVVEFGPIISILASLLVVIRFIRPIKFLSLYTSYKFDKNANSSQFQYLPHNNFKDVNSIMIWAFVFLIGSLLKEPHLFRSITFVPISLGLWISGSLIKIKPSPLPS